MAARAGDVPGGHLAGAEGTAVARGSAHGRITTTERTFVVKVESGKAKWVNVQRGGASGDLVKVLGPLKEGDTVVRRATDEIREGTQIR